MHSILAINPEEEINKIVSFLQKTFAKQKIEKAVLGLSGGIDSATSLFLLSKVLPKEHIHVIHMPYFDQDTESLKAIVTAAGIPEKQLEIISIQNAVDALKKTLHVDEKQTVRLGNIMARVRMITLFDFARKINGLVVGTENKSEYHLAYFTRFGDEASDIEPIRQLYKTQVYTMATYLNVPQFVLDAKPTAGLWIGQTDESEFGFTYKDADEVFLRYFDRKESVELIQKDVPNARQIIAWCNKNSFKHKVPYMIDPESSSG